MGDDAYRRSSRPPDAGDGIFGSLEALVALEERPVTPERRIRLDAMDSTLDPTAQPMGGDDLLALGFVHVGTRGDTSGIFDPGCDVWLDRDHGTYVLLRRGEPLVGGAFRVFTFFIDGSCIETLQDFEAGRFRSDPIHTQRRAGDDLPAEVASHVAAVEARVESGARIIPIWDLHDVERMMRFFVGHVVALSRDPGTRKFESALVMLGRALRSLVRRRRR